MARNVLHNSADSAGQVALVQVDLAKAFERVSQEFLFLLLEHVNVGSTIINGVSLCYLNCTTRLIVNSHLSAPMLFEYSVKQGCPMPHLLFARYLEPLCFIVQNSPIVRGYHCYSEEMKVFPYANDVAFSCRLVLMVPCI